VYFSSLGKKQHDGQRNGLTFPLLNLFRCEFSCKLHFFHFFDLIIVTSSILCIFHEAKLDCFQFLAYLWVIIWHARGVLFPRVFHDPFGAVQFGRIFNDLHLFSSLSCTDGLETSQVHGDTDTPIDPVLQKSVRSTGGTRLTREICLISGITSLALDPKIIQPRGPLQATKLAFTLVLPTWKRE